MVKLFFVTGNNYKFKSAKKYAEKLGFKLIQKKLKIKEIQTDSIEDIVKDKARQAFKIFRKSLVVSDSGWKIPSLKGFPGPYMNYINNWFKAEDFLRLMKGKKDRSVILEDTICVISSKDIKVFKKKTKGVFIKQVKGRGLSSDRVIKLSGCKYTIAECQNTNKESVDDFRFWEKVYQWVKNKGN